MSTTDKFKAEEPAADPQFAQAGRRLKGVVKSWNKFLASGWLATNADYETEYRAPTACIPVRNGKRTLTVGETVEFNVLLQRGRVIATDLTFPATIA